MRKRGVTPVASAMAAVTLAAVTSSMLVIVLMTVETSSTQLNAIELARMAGVAAYGIVGTGKLKFRILVMIEYELLPFSFVMAFFAFFTVASAMNVVDVMAGYAFPGEVLVTLIGMTAVTGGFLVFAV